MFVRVTFLCCSAEEITDFVGREIRNYLLPGLEFVGYSRNSMCVHDALHHFLVDCERNVYFCAFDHCRPMLVADELGKVVELFHRA